MLEFMVWSMLVSLSAISAGVIDGSSYSNRNSIQTSWQITSTDGGGVFIVFPDLEIENSQYCTNDAITLNTSAGLSYRICGSSDNTYMNFVQLPTASNNYITGTYLSKNYVLFFRATWINVGFSSDTSIPSWFKLFYYSDNCTTSYNSFGQYYCTSSSNCRSYCSSSPIIDAYCWTGSSVAYNSTFQVTSSSPSNTHACPISPLGSGTSYYSVQYSRTYYGTTSTYYSSSSSSSAGASVGGTIFALCLIGFFIYKCSKGRSNTVNGIIYSLIPCFAPRAQAPVQASIQTTVQNITVNNVVSTPPPSPPPVVIVATPYPPQPAPAPVVNPYNPAYGASNPYNSAYGGPLHPQSPAYGASHYAPYGGPPQSAAAPAPQYGGYAQPNSAAAPQYPGGPPGYQGHGYQ